jgi:hypothetical protein
MARYNKSADGRYHIHSKTYDALIGTRAQVWHGTAYKTTGGLTKADLMQNKSGRIVSEKKHKTAKRENRLVKSGYGTKKGKFGWVKIGSRRHSKKHSRSRKMRGGMNNSNGLLAPLDAKSSGSNSVQFRAGQTGGIGNSGSSNTNMPTNSTSNTSSNSNQQAAMLQKLAQNNNSDSNSNNSGNSSRMPSSK